MHLLPEKIGDFIAFSVIEWDTVPNLATLEFI